MIRVFQNRKLQEFARQAQQRADQSPGAQADESVSNTVFTGKDRHLSYRPGINSGSGGHGLHQFVFDAQGQMQQKPEMQQ